MQIERNNKLYRQVDGRCWGNQLVHRVSAATNTLAYMSVYWRLVHGSYLTSPFAFFSWIFLVPRYGRDDAVAEKATAALRRWRSCTHPMHPSSSLIHPFTHIYQLIFVFLFFFFFCIFIVEIIFCCMLDSWSVHQSFRPPFIYTYKFQAYFFYMISTFPSSFVTTVN